MAELGDVLFWRIAMRPGRPMAIGRIGAAHGTRARILFGLPGNPVAVMVTFYAFVRDALLRDERRHAEPLPLLRAASTDADPQEARPHRVPARHRQPRAPTAAGRCAITGSAGLGHPAQHERGQRLVVLHHEQGNVAAGDQVDVLPFDGLI